MARHKHLPSTDDVEDHDSRWPIVRFCATLADSTAFNLTIFAIVLANAIVLGLETYDSVVDDYGHVLVALNAIFLGHLRHRARDPDDGVRLPHARTSSATAGTSSTSSSSPCRSCPFFREHATLLRLARLGRVLRIVRLLPDLRVLTLAIGRSIPGVMSLAVLALLVLFVYGMIGWSIFHDFAPKEYGTIGEAMLTLFVTLTLENLPDQIALGRELSDWTIVYFVSYALIAAFLIFNILIGVVINSLEEARAIEHARERADRIEHGGPAEPELEERIADVRQALDALEVDLKRAGR